MSLSAGSAVTKYHSLGGLNNRNLFPTALEAEKSEIRVSAGLGSGEDTFPVWQMATFSLCLLGAERERESKLSLLLL